VDDVPKQYSNGRSLHGMHHPGEDIFVPFSLHGCISYFPTRLPAQEEMDTCRWTTFTSEKELSPYSDHFQKSEKATIDLFRFPDRDHLHFTADGKPIDGRSFGAVLQLTQLVLT
jgi:hypothetical protein